MALRTPQQYQASLRDDRVIYYKGERVHDVTTHPVLQVAVQHACIDYAMAENPRYRELAVAHDPQSGEEISRYYHLPRTTEDLLLRSQLIEAATGLGRTLVVLIKEIGTDALFALHLVARRMDHALQTDYLSRVRQFYQHCARQDLALAVAQTDVKGDRSLGPSQQIHPDYYVRIVDERPDGIVVRGAKIHTSVLTNANEVIVLPTRNLSEADRDYAVAFAVPVNTPGLKMICSPYGAPRTGNHDHPITSQHKMMETLTIFDDVFVPRERVFLQKEWQFAGDLAKTFVEFHRFTAISYKLPLTDALVGAAQLIADYNGLTRAGHIREKITRLIAYTQTLRALTVQAAQQCQVEEEGLAVPSPLLVNIAKLHFAEHYHQMVAYLQDISGGILVTAPGEEDLQNPETRPFVEKYLGGKAGVSAAARLRALSMISELTSSDFGGYQAVLAIHAEGSIEAEKLTIHREYDFRYSLDLARYIAGLSD
ncbi:MAG: gamma-aminobutyrate dehydratase [Candidatus Tectomicrobia bacterium]|uniref:Gamma-aminobutyrate dehydratase n=1 Tax=Tectimicrobiota bacterium TaxID=2528274 RepID=A0A938B0X8_UNCTE|nr:gamma-aminobutyrate dehydratase [Candidatus Tectomicrobia bacterium]